MTTLAYEAVSDDLKPFIPFTEYELDSFPPFPFPTLGNFTPDGWERTGTTWRVRTRRSGGDREALSCGTFKLRLGGYIRENPGHGFAVVDEDDCEVVVTAYRRVDFSL